TPAEDTPARSPEENARILGAFARGTRHGRAAGERAADEELRREPAGEPVRHDTEPDRDRYAFSWETAGEPVRDEAATEAVRDEAATEAVRDEQADRYGFVRDGASPEPASDAPRYEPVWEVLDKEPEPDRGTGAVPDDPAPHEAAHATPHDDEGTHHA
ncbi:hypothetical protein FNH08_47740, partial [Streptomyces spongiae]|nr:hypothetical protein [Streptomyces spongiae]